MKRYLYFIIVFIFFSGCSKLTQYSPYETDTDYSNVNESQIEQIAAQVPTDDSLRFAVFSDSHTSYDDLRDLISSINSHQHINFAICCGDITDSGLAWEFNQYYSVANNCKYPIITAIGNHDYLSNGKTIYNNTFGPTNTTFTFGKYKFIIFDDIVWENHRHSPDFTWLQNELTSTDSGKYDILVTHIPPWTDQLIGVYDSTYASTISSYGKVILALHGHEHTFSQRIYTGIPTIVSGCVKDRSYNIISVKDSVSTLQRIAF